MTDAKSLRRPPGIARYRFPQGEDAESRLARAEDNLLRLRDILAELENRLGPLKEQSEKAQQFLQLSEEKRTLEIGLWLDTLERSGRILREHDDKILIARGQYEDAQKAVETIDAEINRVFEESTACVARADELRQESARREEAAARKDGEASVLENDVLHTKETVARLEREMETARKSDEDTAAEIKEKQEAYSRNEEETNRTEAEQHQLQKKLDELRSGMDEQSGHIADLNRQMADCSARIHGTACGDLESVLHGGRTAQPPANGTGFPGRKGAASRGFGKRAGGSGTRRKGDNSPGGIAPQCRARP